jgi:hypothetical protein
VRISLINIKLNKNRNKIVIITIKIHINVIIHGANSFSQHNSIITKVESILRTIINTHLYGKMEALLLLKRIAHLKNIYDWKRLFIRRNIEVL